MSGNIVLTYTGRLEAWVNGHGTDVILTDMDFNDTIGHFLMRELNNDIEGELPGRYRILIEKVE